MTACRYGISLMFNLISHSSADLTREISSSTLEDNFHIYAHSCIKFNLIWRNFGCNTRVCVASCERLSETLKGKKL